MVDTILWAQREAQGVAVLSVFTLQSALILLSCSGLQADFKCKPEILRLVNLGVVTMVRKI